MTCVAAHGWIQVSLVSSVSYSIGFFFAVIYTLVKIGLRTLSHQPQCLDQL